MLNYHGQVFPPRDVLIYADTIKLDNYKTATIKKFQRRFPDLSGLKLMMDQIALRLSFDDGAAFDPVFFSCCKGAEPHIDKLDPEVYTDTTIVVPLVAPKGNMWFGIDGGKYLMQSFGIYSFVHEREHFLQLEDTESGCTVLMLAIRKQNGSH